MRFLRRIAWAGFLVGAVFTWSGARAGGPVAALPWLHEGLVLTTTWYAAVAPGNGSDYQEDPQGNWIVQSTGQRYDRTMQQGTSGSGWSQATVAALEGDKVIIAVQTYGNAGTLGNNVPVPMQGGGSFVAPALEASDYWMAPDKLAGLHSDGGAGVLVAAGPWKSGEREVQTIRVQTIRDGGYMLHVYDAKTGLCLHYASSQRGAAPKVVGPGDMGQGDVTLTHGDLIAMRDLAIPWAAEAMPDWVGKFKALHYRGSLASRGALPTVPNVVTLDLTAGDRGQHWIELQSTATVQMQGAPQTPPTNTPMAFGRCQFGGLWAGPAALAGLHEGQVLDDDPITKMKTAVAKVSDDSVVITASNPAGEIGSEYDKSTGMLRASSFVNVLSQQQLTVRLQSRE